MIQNHADVDATLLLQIEKFCDQFEQQLKSGKHVDLRSYLAETPLETREKLFQELVLLEWEYHPPESYTIASNDLKFRFPEYTHLLGELVARKQSLETTVDNQHQVTSNQIKHPNSTESFKAEIGPYRLIEPLGQGGMGQVFKAFHPFMQRYVAIKLIRRDQVGTQAAIARFQREIQAAARLEHPNIIRAYDAGQAANNGLFYLAMELADGCDLAHLLKTERSIPVDKACDYIRQAALGMAYAHQCGLIHRDIKPANLFLTKEGVIKVLDLGLARLINDTAKEHLGNAEQGTHLSLTQSGAIIGTPDYMAPEQTYDTQLADDRSDIYSLGCTFYFLLTGNAPFYNQTTLDRKLYAHRHYQPKNPIERYRSDLPSGLAVLVRTMMAKNPNHRFPSMKKVADALAPFCSGNLPYAIVPQVHYQKDPPLLNEESWHPPDTLEKSLHTSEPELLPAPQPVTLPASSPLRYSLAKQLEQAQSLADSYSVENQRRQLATLEKLMEQHVANGNLPEAYDTTRAILEILPTHQEANELSRYLRKKLRSYLALRVVGKWIDITIMATAMACCFSIPGLGLIWVAYWLQEKWEHWVVTAIAVGLKLLTGALIYGMALTGLNGALHQRWFRRAGKVMAYVQEVLAIAGMLGGAVLMTLANWNQSLLLILIGFGLTLCAFFIAPNGLPFHPGSNKQPTS